MDGHKPEPIRNDNRPLPRGINDASMVLASSDPLFADLPDNRATQRLLNVLGKLEAYHANLAAANGTAVPGRVVSGAAITSELTRLRQENRHLKLRQRHAIEHLDALIARLPDTDDTEPLVHTLTITDAVPDTLNSPNIANPATTEHAA